MKASLDTTMKRLRRVSTPLSDDEDEWQRTKMLSPTSLDSSDDEGRNAEHQDHPAFSSLFPEINVGAVNVVGQKARPPVPTADLSSFSTKTTRPALISCQSSSSSVLSLTSLEDQQCSREENSLFLPRESARSTTRPKAPTATSTPAEKWFRWTHLFVAMIAVVSSSSLLMTSMPRKPVEPRSVFVPGAGFSGFWFTLGRLKSIPNPTEHNYYCFSAGCLGVVAALNGFSMEEMYSIAVSAQNRWKSGEISRYEVVPAFVDDLLERSIALMPTNDGGKNNETVSMDLSSLNIITTVKDGSFGIKHSIRTPSNMASLRTMLLQTTWIPFAVGDGLWHQDHMDGGFSPLHHPACEINLGLPLDVDLLANIVNVNLSRQKVEKFWNKGLAYGL